MRDFQIELWFRLNRLTSGRRGHAARRIKAESKALDLPTIGPLCDALIDKEAKHSVLEGRYRAARAQNSTTTWSAEVLEQDRLLDRLLVTFRDLLAALAKLPWTPRGDAAEGMLAAYFQDGVTYYTHAIIEDESARVGALLERLDGDSERIIAATADDLVADISVAHERYVELIQQVELPERVEFSAVKASDLANQRQLLELVAEIFAATRELDDDARATAREALLREVARHDAEVSAAISAKRRVIDVHPETGEPLETDEGADA